MDYVDVIGYEGLYKINQAGEVFNVKRQKILKPTIGNNKYYKLVLSKNNIKKTYMIHRLVALHFIPNPNNLPIIDHIDRNRLNNLIDNLRWVTNRDNCLNTYKKSNSGEQNITLTKGNLFNVQFVIDKKKYFKYFKTIEEAKVYKDAFMIEHRLDK